MTSLAPTRFEETDEALPRQVEWASLVFQIEALIVMMSPALALLMRDGVSDPRPALSCLVIGPILWRIGHGISRGSRGAIGVMLGLYLLRLFSAVGTPGGPDTVTIWMVIIEGVALTLAARVVWDERIHADPAWRGELWWGTLVPLALAVMWWMLVIPLWAARFRVQFPERDNTLRTPLVVLACFLIGTALALTWRTALIQRVYHVFRPSATPLDIVARDAADRATAYLKRPPGLDFLIGGVVGALAFAVLQWVAYVNGQPHGQIVPGRWLVPGGLAGLAAALLWVLCGLGMNWKARWVRGVRGVAVVISGLLLGASTPFVVELMRTAYMEWARTL
jgi:hypothetical protein